MDYNAKRISKSNIKHDFSGYKFRPSSVRALLVEPRSKSEQLSETAKSYLLECYIQEVFGRQKDTSSKYTEKGNANEVVAKELVQEFLGVHYIPASKEKFSNDFITGTPDIVLEDKVIDIKSSWDIFTFANASGDNDQYYVQLQCYMWLTGKKKALLAYVLTDTPEQLIQNETYRQSYYKGGDTSEEYNEWLEKYLKLATYGDLQNSEKIKVFEYEYNPVMIDNLERKILSAREYLNNFEW